MKMVNGLPACKSSGVYVITNASNGKTYVGSATSIRGRLIYHRSHLRRGKHDNGILQAAWNKYGEPEFVFKVLELCEISQCLVREQYWIDSLGSHKSVNGYNICPVAGYAMLGRKHSKKSCDKMSKQRKGIVPIEAIEAAAIVNRGRKLSNEECQARSERLKGVKKSKEHVAALKSAHWSKKMTKEEVSAIMRKIGARGGRRVLRLRRLLHANASAGV